MKTSSPIALHGDPLRICESPVKLRSNLLRYERGVAYILRPDARADERAEARIDFHNFHLPATNLATGCCLDQDVEAVSVILLLLDRYLCSAKSSMGFHRTAGSIAHTIAKLYEYSRLRGIYSLKNLTHDHFTILAGEIASGGWYKALNLHIRCEALLGEGVPPNIFDGSELHFTRNFRKQLRTSAGGRELNTTRKLVIQKLLNAEEACEAPSFTYTQGHLRQIFEAINELVAIDNNFAAKIIPFPEPRRLAKALGRPSCSTENLQIDVAAPLLAHSLIWLVKRGGDVLRLVNALYNSRTLFAALQDKHDNTTACLTVQELLPLLSGKSIAELRGNEKSAISEFNRILGSLVTACFIIIAAMNARRRNEVIHRLYGVYETCITVESVEFQIYLCNFYVEKSLKDYDKFYVNESTYKAVTILAELQTMVRLHEGTSKSIDPKQDTVFKYPLVTMKGVFGRQRWFNFESRMPHVADFLKRASNTDTIFRITPHMFRRFYAVLFMYRFEDASLQALSQDLGHFDLEMTRQYVIDTTNTPKSKRIPPGYRIRQTAGDSYRDEIDLALREVGQEKLQETVSGILEGKAYSGGFEKLIRRIHNKQASRVEYRIASAKSQAEELARRLAEKGYEVRPFPHGECMAGSVTKRALGHCKSEITGEIDQSKARPEVCKDCAYHHVSEGYVNSIRMLIVELDEDIEKTTGSSLRTHMLVKERNQAESVLAFHIKRIERFK